MYTSGYRRYSSIVFEAAEDRDTMAQLTLSNFSKNLVNFGLDWCGTKQGLSSRQVQIRRSACEPRPRLPPTPCQCPYLESPRDCRRIAALFIWLQCINNATW